MKRAHTVGSLAARLARDTQRQFRQQLFQRCLESGRTAVEGAHYLYTNGYGVLDRVASAEDAQAVNAELEKTRV